MNDLNTLVRQETCSLTKPVAIVKAGPDKTAVAR